MFIPQRPGSGSSALEPRPFHRSGFTRREGEILVRALRPRPFVRIPVAVSRLSSGDELLGWEQGTLKMRVVAGPTKGRDDAAVESLLADVLDIERERVRVVVGRGSRRKWVEIEDIDEDELDRRLPGRSDQPDEGDRPGPGR